MRHLLFLLLCLIMAQTTLAATTQIDLNIQFEKDRGELTEAAVKELQEFIASVDLDSDHQFIVHGHTDSDGARAYNESLSMARAASVQHFLLEQGVDPDRIEMAYFGERSPLAPNTDTTGMAMNRRVTISFISNVFNDTSELQHSLLDRNVQCFTIDPTKDEEIQGADGTLIRFNALTLIDGSGRPAREPVEIQLTEALDLRSMVAHSLSTRSGNELLETGGMIKVEAFSAEKAPLQLRNGGTMEVAIPTLQTVENMELFYSDDGTDWNAAGQELTNTTMNNVIMETRRKWDGDPDRLPPFKMPVYRGSSKGAPLKPSPPVSPRMPIAPREESYAIKAPWWKPWAEKKYSALGARRYQQAIAEYEEKCEKHEKKMAYYEEEVAGYADKLLRYEVRSKEWEEQKSEAYETWKRTVKAEAIRERAKLYETMNLNRDSLNKALEQEFDLRIEQRPLANPSMDAALRSDNAMWSLMSGKDAYLFSSNQLGWLNCDRFMQYPKNQLHEVIVKNDHNRDKQVLLIFEDLNSVLAMYPNKGGELRSGPVPLKEKITLFAYTVIDGRTHLCIEEITAGKAPELKFEPSSRSELAKKLQEIRRNRS